RLKAESGHQIRPPASIAKRVVEQIDIDKIVAARGKKRRTGAIGQVGPGKRPAHFHAPKVIKVIANSEADKRRDVLVNTIGNEIIQQDPANESAEIKRTIPPTRANQRLAEPDVPVGIVRVTMCKPRMGKQRMHLLLPGRPVE